MIKHLTPRPAEEIKRIVRSAKIKARKKRLWELSTLGIYFTLFIVFFILKKIGVSGYDKPYSKVCSHIIDTINNKRNLYVDTETTNLLVFMDNIN